MDIDFAVKFVLSDRAEKVDLEKVITDLGYIPVVMRSGIRRFTRENFTVEFVAHRKGGRDDQVVSIRKWNITASPLPFVDLLLSFPFTADFGNFKVRAPLPEAFLSINWLRPREGVARARRTRTLINVPPLPGSSILIGWIRL